MVRCCPREFPTGGNNYAYNHNYNGNYNHAGNHDYNDDHTNQWRRWRI